MLIIFIINLDITAPTQIFFNLECLERTQSEIKDINKLVIKIYIINKSIT